MFKILICRHWSKTGGSWGSLFSSTKYQYGIQQWVKLYIISPTVVMTGLVIKPRHRFAFALFNILLKRLAFRISPVLILLKGKTSFFSTRQNKILCSKRFIKSSIWVKSYFIRSQRPELPFIHSWRDVLVQYLFWKDGSCWNGLRYFLLLWKAKI